MKSPQVRPQNASYVLVRRVDEAGQLCCKPAAYEDGQFFYPYDRVDRLLLDARHISGWSYYPYDEHP